MKTNIFIPETIKVGFQNRESTYTGKLAYVIYYDQKGVLRKERSWESWRDKNIPDVNFSNVPTSGFVLNKKVGDYVSDWNHRQAYVRVYDPRNFEFEITIENLLYLLDNTNSIKGKGLEGLFVYGWDGKDLILIPTSSPDYTELTELNNLRYAKKKFDGKNLILGGTYKSNDNNSLIYLGRFYENNENNKETKTYFFYNKNTDCCKITTIKTLTGNIIDIIDETCVEDYAEIMDELLKSSNYSAREPKYDEYKDYILEDFKQSFNDAYWGHDYYVQNSDNQYIKYKVKKDRNYYHWNSNYQDYTYSVYTLKGWRTDEEIISKISLDRVYNKINPKYLTTYNSNHEIIKEWK